VFFLGLLHVKVATEFCSTMGLSLSKSLFGQDGPVLASWFWCYLSAGLIVRQQFVTSLTVTFK